MFILSSYVLVFVYLFISYYLFSVLSFVNSYFSCCINLNKSTRADASDTSEVQMHITTFCIFATPLSRLVKKKRRRPVKRKKKTRKKKRKKIFPLQFVKGLSPSSHTPISAPLQFGMGSFSHGESAPFVFSV